MTTLDRLYFVSYLRSYGIVLLSVLSLYIILDLFTNLDEFSGRGFAALIEHVLRYYSTRISQIFDRLSEFLSLIAAVFTVAWMQKNNELLPQLSAGIPTRRVVRPVLLGAIVTLALGPLNQEFVIPRIAEDLLAQRSDLDHERPTDVKGGFDSTGVHLEGGRAYQNQKRVEGLFVTLPADSPTGMLHLTAKDAKYVPAGSEPLSGGWLLYQTTSSRGQDLATDTLPPYLTRVTYGQYFLKTREIDFDSVTRSANWFMYASTTELRELLSRPDPRRQPAVATVFHMRLTRPLVGAVLVLMGLAVVLRDQNRNVFINAGLCLVLCAVCYAAVYGCKYLGENDFLPPALAAWLPVLVFGPISLALFDAVHT